MYRTFTSKLVGKYQGSRTIEYQLNLVIDALNPVIDPRYFIIDAVSDLQELRDCHPNFLLSQFIQPTERVFDIRLSNQLHEKLF